MALVSIDEGCACVLNGETISWRNGRDRIVVSTSRCGRDNPGSNPGHGRGCEVSIMACQSALLNFPLRYQSPFDFTQRAQRMHQETLAPAIWRIPHEAQLAYMTYMQGETCDLNVTSAVIIRL